MISKKKIINRKIKKLIREAKTNKTKKNILFSFIDKNRKIIKKNKVRRIKKKIRDEGI